MEEEELGFGDSALKLEECIYKLWSENGQKREIERIGNTEFDFQNRKVNRA